MECEQKLMKATFKAGTKKVSHNDLSRFHLVAQRQSQEEARNLLHPLGENTIWDFI